MKCSCSYLGFRQCKGQEKDGFKNVGCLLMFNEIDVRKVYFDILNKNFNSSKIHLQVVNVVFKSEVKLKLFIHNESM